MNVWIHRAIVFIAGFAGAWLLRSSSGTLSFIAACVLIIFAGVWGFANLRCSNIEYDEYGAADHAAADSAPEAMPGNDPILNRRIMYVILFAGFALFAKGARSGNMFLTIISLALIIGSFIWGIMKVRCPHCGGLLQLKLYDISLCPHCGKRTTDI